MSYTKDVTFQWKGLAVRATLYINRLGSRPANTVECESLYSVEFSGNQLTPELIDYLRTPLEEAACEHAGDMP